MKLTRLMLSVAIGGVLGLASACSQSPAPNEVAGTIMKPTRAITEESASPAAPTESTADAAAADAAKGTGSDASGAANASKAAGMAGNGNKNK